MTCSGNFGFIARVFVSKIFKIALQVMRLLFRITNLPNIDDLLSYYGDFISRVRVRVRFRYKVISIIFVI